MPGRDTRANLLYWINQFAVVDDQPGGTRHVEMARLLHADGVELRVVASDLNLSWRRYTRRDRATDRRHIEEDAGGPSFVWLPAGSYEQNDWRRMLSMLVFSLHVLLYLIRAPMPRGSLVIGSSPHLPGALMARLAAALRRVPFVFEVRDLWPESLAVDHGRRRLLYWVLRVVADLLYRTSDAIVVLAPGSVDAITARGVHADRITCVPNGVDPAAFNEAAPTRPDPVPAEAPLLVYAGAHGPANDLETVLHAMDELEDRGARAHLLLIGDGPSKRSLVRIARKLALSNVTFLDPVPKSEIPSLLKACDVGVMSLADVELFQRAVSPNKLFDYLCAGMKVVSNVPGVVADMVEESAAGITCHPADPVALADAIETAVAAPATEDGRRWVIQAHSRDELTERFRRVVDEVVDARGRPRTS